MPKKDHEAVKCWICFSGLFCCVRSLLLASEIISQSDLNGLVECGVSEGPQQGASRLGWSSVMTPCLFSDGMENLMSSKKSHTKSFHPFHPLLAASCFGAVRTAFHKKSFSDGLMSTLEITKKTLEKGMPRTGYRKRKWPTRTKANTLHSDITVSISNHVSINPQIA